VSAGGGARALLPGVLLVAGARHYLPDTFGVTFAPELDCAGAARSDDEEREDDEPRDAAKRDREARADAGDADEETDEAQPDAGVAPVPRTAGRLRGRKRSLRSMFARGDEADGPVHFASPVDEPLRGLEPLPMLRPGKIELAPHTEHDVILGAPDESGEASLMHTLGVVVRRGKGRVIVLASASMLQNRALGPSQGGVTFARLLRAFAPGGPVMFDEYHLGVGERRSLVRYLREAGGTPFALQLFFAVLLFLWRGGARFGGLRESQEPLPLGSASLVTAMGNLFGRTRDAAGASQILIRQALSRVAAHHHVPAAPAQILARSLQEKGLHDAARAVAGIALAERAVAGPGGLAAKSRHLDLAVRQALGPFALRGGRKLG